VTKVLHLVDRQTPPDMLRCLSLLAGAEDMVVSLGPPPRWDRPPLPLPVTEVHCPMDSARLGALRLPAGTRGAEIVHAWSRRTAEAAGWVARRRSVPAVVSWPSLPAKSDLPALKRLIDRSRLTVTVPTEVAQSSLVWAGAAEASVHVVGTPAPVPGSDEAAALRARLRSSLALTDAHRLLVSPAPLVRPAGHKYACWVHAIIRQIVGDVLLLIPSTGPAEPRVRHFAGTTMYEHEVFYRGDCGGDLSGADFRLAALAAADVVLLLAERDCGTASLAEAMAAGAAIAASNTPDTSELAPSAAVALLGPACDPRAAAADVLKLIEDRGLAIRLGAAARKRAAGIFDPAACRGQLDRAYGAAAR
jgi:glycosyltransferase involved in cell wall biosynthesis